MGLFKQTHILLVTDEQHEQPCCPHTKEKLLENTLHCYSKAMARVDAGNGEWGPQVDPHWDTGEKPSGTQAQKHSNICIYMHMCISLALSLSVMHTQTQPHMHGLTQPWNPLRLGDLAKQLIHSAFDLFPIFSLQSANWEKQKRRGDCCMSPRDQTKERPRDWQKMLCVWWLLRLCTSKRRAKYRLEALWMVNQHGCIK